MASTNAKRFDLNAVYTHLTACYEKSDKLDLDSYILAYHEFNKYFISVCKMKKYIEQ